MIFFIVLVLFSTFALYNSYINEKNKVENSIRKKSFLISQWIHSSFESSKYILKSIVQDVPLSEVVYPIVDKEMHKLRTQYLLNKMSIVPNAFTIGLFDKNCIVTHANAYVGFDASKREYCIKTKANSQNESYLSTAYLSNKNKLNVTQTYKFKSNDLNHFYGFAALAINLDFFNKWLNKIEISHDSIIIIIDSKLSVLANKSQYNIALGEKLDSDILKKFIESEKTNIIYEEKFSFDNNVRMINAYKVEDLPFIVIVGETNKIWLTHWYKQLFYTVALFIFSLIVLYVLFKNYKLLVEQKKKLEEISITDGLTDIYNRRYFNEIFPKVINSAKRKNELLSFIIMDIDYFKQYNDTYGHQMGDDVLIKIAKAIKDSFHRADDYCFRLGGEEFGILFKIDTKDKALELANTIKENIENLEIEHSNNIASSYVTVSMGLICKDAKDINSNDEVYKEADDLLYKAKEAGRNRVES